MAFQVGNTVEKVLGENDGEWAPIGAIGLVDKVDHSDVLTYHVTWEGDNAGEWCGEYELKLVPEDSNSAPPSLVAAVESIRSFSPPEPTVIPLLPTSSLERKSYPIIEGVFDYFPAVMREMARLSHLGNEKHNKGQPLHWSRQKSSDHENCIGRHTLERGGYEEIIVDGVSHFVRHSVCRAWRACAAAQIELEEAGEAPIAITPRPKSIS